MSNVLSGHDSILVRSRAGIFHIGWDLGKHCFARILIGSILIGRSGYSSSSSSVDRDQSLDRDCPHPLIGTFLILRNCGEHAPNLIVAYYYFYVVVVYNHLLSSILVVISPPPIWLVCPLSSLLLRRRALAVFSGITLMNRSVVCHCPLLLYVHGLNYPPVHSNTKLVYYPHSYGHVLYTCFYILLWYELSPPNFVEIKQSTLRFWSSLSQLSIHLLR